MISPFDASADKRAPCLVGQLDEHLQREKRYHRCPNCGAFAKPMWLPYPGLGTDPKWECKKCGART